MFGVTSEEGVDNNRSLFSFGATDKCLPILRLGCKLFGDQTTKYEEEAMKRIVAGMMGLILLMAVASFAQATKAEPERGSVKGTISSVDGGKLVVSGASGFQKFQTTFVLNADTKKEGNLKTGTYVIVYYKNVNNQKIATLVKAK